MVNTICKITILFASALLVLAPISPIELNSLLCISGVVILISSLPSLGSSYKKPVYIFLFLSVFLFIKYQLSLRVLVTGVNSMWPIAAIVAVMQIFAIPIKVGNYDKVLENYLKTKFEKEVSLYMFLSLITHLLGSFMIAGSIPMLCTIFYEPLKKMVHEPKRFMATALSRSFSLVTLWAPGTINVILVLQVTGAKWMQVLVPAIFLTLLGLVTSVLLEVKLHLKDHRVQSMDISSREYNDTEKEDKKKFRTLILISVGLIASIIIMENLHILTSITRVLVSALFIAFIWILRYKGNPELPIALRGYWDKSISGVQDLAALFIIMGIFAEAVYQAGLISYIQPGLIIGVNFMGQYSFFLIPPALILLSLIGIHPFISTLLMGKIFVSAIQMPHYEIFIALSLLLGGVISFVLSPFAGNILTISKMMNSSPSEVGYKWNGLFSLIFLMEGIVLLFILKALIT